jgi:F0F1-type ATP synthase membrane subunit c/vacuolar-type H+-ATPase subunit K
MRGIVSTILSIVFAFCIMLLRGVLSPTFGASFDFGFATYVPVLDKNVEDGSVVITSQNGIYLSRYPYDEGLTGVINLKPAIVLGFKKDGEYPITTRGKVHVRVSTENGSISKGDYLTSSTLPGAAMRATKSGMVLGIALADYIDDKQDAVGKIPVYLEIKFNEVGVKEPEYAVKKDVARWRVMFGGVMAVVTTVMCFILYGKYTSKVVEAMARNPIASKSLKRHMFIQGFFLLLFVATGYAVAYFLLRG